MVCLVKHIAFFDVDETIIATKSMFDFLWFLGEREAGIDASAIISNLQQLSKEGASRASINVQFWRYFSGLDSARVERFAEEWFGLRTQQPDTFFIPSVLNRLEFHQASGDVVALVSGSATVILKPIARRLGANYLFATRLIEHNGVYTGDILPPVMIGSGKQEAVRNFAISLGFDLADCYVYGDHVSDLPMLEAVGHPTAIGAEGELAEIARARGWPVLPGIEAFKMKGAAA